MVKYHSYKSSGIEFIGNIPEHWCFIKLKHEYKIQKGRIPKKLFDIVEDGLVPYLSMDVLRGSEVSNFVSNDDGIFVEKEQIMILWDGSNSGEIIRVNNEGILSSTMGVLNKVGKKLNEDFSFYQLKSNEPEIRNNTNGMGIPHVDGQFVRSLVLLTPPLHEQEQIVKYLDEKTSIIDKLIYNKQRKIELLKEQRTSLINEVITKGLNPNVKMKDSFVEWIGEIPDGWVVIKLKYVGKINSGDGISSELIDNEGTYPVYGGNGIMGYFNNYNFSHKVLSIGRVGEKCGNVHLVSQKSWINDNSLVLDLRNNEIDINYLFNTLTSRNLNSIRNQNTQPLITGTMVKDEFIPKPPLHEQQQIVEYLNKHTKEIDDLVGLEQRKIELLKEYRQSLISEVITGKIKVVE